MFRRVSLVALLALSSCQNVSGPLAYRRPDRPDDPRLPIEEQKARGRERYTYVEDDRLSVKTYVDRPTPVGR